MQHWNEFLLKGETLQNESLNLAYLLNAISSDQKIY